MDQSNLTASQKDTLAKINQIIYETSILKEQVENNTDLINRALANFKLNYESIGTDVYGNNPYSSNNGVEFQLPNEADYRYLRELINKDIDDIEVMIEKHSLLADLINDVPMFNKLLVASSISLDDINELKKKQKARIELLNTCDDFYSLAMEKAEERVRELERMGEENDESMKTVNNTDGDTGGSPGGTPGGSPSESPEGSPGGNPSNPSSADDLGVEASPTVRPELKNYNTSVSFNNLKFLSYQGELNMNFFGTCASRLATHHQSIADVMKNININGDIPGADFYGVDKSGLTQDLNFNPGALQLLLDMIDAEITAIEQYVSLMTQKKNANVAKIAVLQAKANAAKARDEDPSSYYAEIEALEAENEELEAKINEQNANKQKASEIFNQYANYWNAYNKKCGGLASAFVAIDFMDKVSTIGADADLYGLALTAAQKKQLFNNLGATVDGLRGQLSDVINKKGDYCGGLTSDQIDYIVAGCSILGKVGKSTFQENFNQFEQFNKAANEAGGIENMDSSKLKEFGIETRNSTGKVGEKTTGDSSKTDVNDTQKDSVSTSSKDKDSSEINPKDAVVSTLDGCKLALQYMVTHKARSDVVVDEAIADILTQNAGKTIIVPDIVLKALDMQTCGYFSIPENYDPDVAYPFLLWLPGTGFHSNGQDTLKTDFTGEPLLKQFLNGKMNNDTGIIFISTGWGEGTYEQHNSIYHVNLIDHDLHQIMENLNVDHDHIACAGSSIGAFATAALVQENPNLFSAVAMTGGGFNGVFQSVDFYEALKNSPDTSYIWVMAPDDKTSPGTWYDRDTGKSSFLGVSYYTYNQHLKLLEAGRNSMFYEFGSEFDFEHNQETGIWHSYTVDRFPNSNMIQDLFSITKGVKYNYPELSDRKTIIVPASETISPDKKLDPNLPWYKKVT